MTNPESPDTRICARPGCEEIVRPREGSGDLPLYHSKECRTLARKLRRAANREMFEMPPPDAGVADPGVPDAGVPDADPMDATWAAAMDAWALDDPPPGEPPLTDPATSATRRKRRLAALVGGMTAAALVAALVISLSQDSHHRAIATAQTGRTGQPRTSVAPRPTAASITPSDTKKAQPGRKRERPNPVQSFNQPVVVSMAHTSPPASATHKAAPPTFTALTGPGCPTSSSASIAIDSTWYAQSSGGWTQNGCSGMYYAKWVHQPGDATVRTFTWQFHTGLAGKATCKVSVYIPNGDSTTVGANPAPYEVYSGSQEVGSFGLDQLDNHGSWLYAGAFPSSGGQFSVQLENVGAGSVEAAADALIVSCTG